VSCYRPMSSRFWGAAPVLTGGEGRNSPLGHQINGQTGGFRGLQIPSCSRCRLCFTEMPR
jgi:hypothetical protein